MTESDGLATRMARSSEVEESTVDVVSESYIREQLEKRREQLNTAVTSPEAAAPAAALTHLLGEVDSALQRLNAGTFGICVECHESVEKDRLLSDPLVTLCLDHLSNDEQRALERDLELAAKVQRGLLPQADLRHGEWSVHYQYKPAGMVSGDYCDLIPPANGAGELVFLLGDVAGKGVAASLLMTHLHAMFRSLAGVGLPLDKLLETANSVFCRSTIAGQYATLVCGRARKEGEIEIGSAGHLAALVIGKDGVRQVSSTGVPLGMFATSQYAIQCVCLERGDSLLLYTDGISEAVDGSGAEYGIERLANIASKWHGRAPRELAASCMSDVQAYSKGLKQFDDQTLMVIHRSPSSEVQLAR
jgi:sigma-B regulation protein RsbU (phosphoserine phosphatase)